MSQTQTAAIQSQRYSAVSILAGVSFAHLLNDAMQTAVPSAFPLFQASMHLSFTKIGWVAFMLNITASLLQPLIGYMSDRRPMPGLLPLGMVFSLVGLLGFAYTQAFWMLLVSAALIGVGSSVLHPESSRVARLAAGKGRGLAQSVFQVGGNTGQALAPLLVAFIIMPHGPKGFLWFTIAAVIGIAVQLIISRWYADQLAYSSAKRSTSAAAVVERARSPHTTKFIVGAMAVLIALLFSKFVYIASMTGFYSFYFIEHYNLPISRAQLCLFALQFAGMVGTLLGGRWRIVLAVKR
uniref:MFS transporter n=1 Tax=Paenibacillus hexagrammi TaxID=2908839 RepID=UPI0028832DBA|nr:MFS transporter [Paenibacillus sp. YPD9-1]